ncbi:MAG: IS66 family transposase [Aliidongia sp.]
MTTPSAALPDDVETLKAALLAAQTALEEACARAAGAEAMVAHLRLMIAKLRRDQFGQSSERGRKLLDQLELQLEEAEASATEDAAASDAAKPETSIVKSFERKKPVRAPLPAHLPRERVVLPAPCSCPACGGKLAKLGEDITETLEVIPRQWKVIQTVREKFSCRSCEKITQPPAPFHPIIRGRAGASLLAMVLYAKYGSHQPLNRQSESFAREGIDLDVSTLADWVGACTATLSPLTALIQHHVMAASRLHGDETTVPVLAKLKTVTGRLWTYVRDDRPFGGEAPPAAVFFYSRDRAGEHPARHLAGYTGILQADAYAGFGALYEPKRSPGPITEAACWSHSRRKFFELADIAQAARRRSQKYPANLSPLALEAVRRIDRIFDIERNLNGLPHDQRLELRKTYVASLVEELETWMRAERARLSRHNPVAKAMDYMLTRWSAFTRFLADGRICLTNNAAERALRCIAIGRRNWTFCGSDRGGERAAAIYTLVATAKLNDIDPEAWLADVLRRINDHPASRLHELLPWNWRKTNAETAEAA